MNYAREVMFLYLGGYAREEALPAWSLLVPPGLLPPCYSTRARLLADGPGTRLGAASTESNRIGLGLGGMVVT